MIKNFLSDVFGRRPSAQPPEWRTDESIYNFILSRLGDDGNLHDSGVDLPDEKREDNNLKFAAGLMDAVFGPEDSEASAAKVSELSQLATRISKTGNSLDGYAFYQLITQNESVIAIVDAFLERVVGDHLPVEPNLFTFAHDLATRAGHRNAVKFGIAILGVCQNRTVVNEVMLLGAHDEFTVYAAVAVSNLSPTPAADLCDLAKKVNGWGRIQVVDRLASMDLTDEIRDWLIREGFKNSIMYEYLAFTCATAGCLHKRLEGSRIDSGLYKSSGEIISALLMGGPAEGISEYMYAPFVIADYIRHAKHHISTLSDFLVLHKIKSYLLELQARNAPNDDAWTDDMMSNCLIELMVLVNGRDWTQPTMEGLKSSDSTAYWNAKHAAEILGIDLWDTVWERLKKNPLNGASWYDVTHYATPDKADLIINFASTNLPLNELGCGPKDSLGLGENYQIHHSLDYVITFLENHPRKGEVLLLTGLKSPVTRNRNLAIKTLARWKEENWSKEIRSELYHLKTIEPDANTLKNIERLIDGDELDWSVHA